MFVSSQNSLWLLIPKKQRFVPYIFRCFTVSKVKRILIRFVLRMKIH